MSAGALEPIAVPPGLRRQVARSRSSEITKGLLLLSPAAIFLAFTFLLPLTYILRLSVYDPTIHDGLPRTAEALSKWTGAGLPQEQTYRALAEDLADARRLETIGTLANRLNVEVSGLRSVISRTSRRLSQTTPSDKLAAWFRNVDPAWGDPATWRAIERLSHPVTANYYLAAADLRRTATGGIEFVDSDHRIHGVLFLRTFLVAMTVTILCMILGYPVAFLVANSSKSVRSLLIVLVLLPFWTSLLVRTTGWIVLLQSQGVINDGLVALGIVTDEGRIRMIYNLTGTLIAMTHILLPFFILPLYSVMSSISPIYLRAAQSLGANKFYAFRKVYFPNTLPGVGSGALLVFILAVGYYITPALVGGQSGQMISNVIAYHVQSSLNWGLAAALGMILLAFVLILYIVYQRCAGANRFRFG